MENKKKSKRCYLFTLVRTNLLIILCLFSSFSAKCCNDSLFFKAVIAYINESGDKIQFTDSKGLVYVPFLDRKHFKFMSRKDEDLEAYYDMRKIAPFFERNVYISKSELSIDELYRISEENSQNKFIKEGSNTFFMSPLYKNDNKAFITTEFFDDVKKMTWNIIFLFKDEKVDDVIIAILTSGPNGK